jgi:hypothetical protein
LAKSVLIAAVAIPAIPVLAQSQTYVAGQVFHGDAASFNPATGLYTATQNETTPTGCLSCHYSYGKANYLKTGHKNMLRKVVPGQVWARSDGTLFSSYFTRDLPPNDPNCGPGSFCDSLYGSGSLFDWAAGTVTPPGAHAVPIYYVFGGWLDPTQLNTIFQGGFTGEQWPNGNYDCAHCHTTGYRADGLGPEPTDARTGLKISDANFSRVPTNSTTSSWAIEGITCERCHVADVGDGVHNHFAIPCQPWLGPNLPAGCYDPTPPTGVASTQLCLECHRTEVSDLTQYVQDGGACADGSGANYADCVNGGGTWNYAPYIDHASGLTFLNSPHARYTGTIVPNQTDANDPSLTLDPAKYNSYFNIEFSGGCVQCHQVHESFTDPNGAPLKPTVKDSSGKLVSSGVCTGCHAQYATNFLAKTDHKITANTPYGLAGGNLDTTCTVCHMSQGFHYFRISVDPGYSTFPTASAFYRGQAAPNTASDGTLTSDGKPFQAVWNDVDITCGQCHIGSSASIGLPLTVLGAPVFDKPTLAQDARCIHHQPLVHINSGPNGSVSPAGVYNPLYAGGNYSPTFTFAPAPGYEVHSVNADGAVYYGNQTSWAFTNLTDCHHLDVQFSPMPTIAATAGAGGTISPPATTVVNTGGSVAYTVTASTGYQIANVIVDGATSVGAGAVSPFTYTFSNVQGSHTIAASFQAIPPPAPSTFKIYVSAAGGGTITNNADATVISSGSGTEIVAKGSTITFSLNPAAGYKVGYVAVNGVGLPAPLPASYTFSNVRFNNNLSVSFYRLP